MVARIDLEGPGEVAPGTEAQFVVKAQYSNGTLLDVTPQSEFSIVECDGCPENDVLSVRAGGVVRAGGRGEATLLAKFSGHTAGKELIAVPANSYRLTGFIMDPLGYGGLVADARVDVQSPAGPLTTMTSFNGQYRLYGVAGATTVQVVKDGYQLRQELLTVTGHQKLDIQVQAALTRPNQVHALRIRAASDCAPAGAQGTLPPVARDRRYVATLSTLATGVFARLSGATFATVPNYFGGIRGDGLTGRTGPGQFDFSMPLYEICNPDYYSYPDLG